MEARKITIVQTKNQKKSVIMTSATTLGELKDDLRTNGIDYNGMTFYEGLSKTELKTDESILPHDIERGGVITNELVFMLTNTEKKIKSGATMTRQQAYSTIKSQGLQDACVKMFGRNFTQCSTENLIVLIEKKGKGSVKETPKPQVKKESKKEPEIAVVVAPAAPSNEEPHNCKGCVDTQARAAITELVKILCDTDVIDEDDKDSVLDILDGGVASPVVSAPQKKENESPYSDDEINQMFRGMR